jgi:hypothetical protein
MGTSLNGTTPQNTYPSLIKVTDNTALSATAKYLSDGQGNDSALSLSTDKVGIGTNAPSATLQIQGDGTNDIARFFNGDPIKTVFISNRGEIGAKSEFSGDGGFVGYNGNFLTQVFALKRNGAAGLAVQSLSNIGFSVNGANSVSSYEMELTDTGNLIIGGSSGTASAILQANSTTQGFLPPRMTTTEKNAISSPAAGLIIYDTTLAKLCVYTTAWETITST